jgi:uncharacterized 2Fe-2S/4Fe-4S cluster protein (DUF4445 family)
LSNLLRQSELSLNTRCGQRGLCDGCLVELVSGCLVHARTGETVDRDRADGPLQACQYCLPDGVAAEIRIPGRSLLAHEPQVVTSFSVNVSRAHDPLWQRFAVQASDLGEATTLAEAICREVEHRRDGDLPVRAADGLRRLNVPRDGAMVTALEQVGDCWLVGPCGLAQDARPYGVAVDIGTTTVVVLLVDLDTGDVVGTASALNRQTRLGDNVLTRINLCLQNERMIGRLQQAVVAKTLRPLVEQLLSEQEIASSQIVSLVIAGNTTMLHLVAGVDPGSMGTAPFTPQFVDHRVLRASDLPLARKRPAVAVSPSSGSRDAAARAAGAERSDASGESAQEAGSKNFNGAPSGDADSPPQASPPGGFALGAIDPAVHLLPGAAAYVGADVMAGVFSSGMVYEPETCLLVDVGTNGEIVLKHGDHLLGCATAAGPAFEGSGLTCGMRAGRGAVSHIRLETDPAHPEIDVIGGVPPIGLCGTAYVDFVAQARHVGLISPTGRFTPESEGHPRREDNEHGRTFTVADGVDDERIFISELDIASLLQAKAAIAAGIICLLRRVELTSRQVKTLYLAGGFGFHMDVGNVIRCGLLPGFQPEQIRLVGNTSLAGAYLALLDSSVLEEIKTISRRLETIELNLDPGFESCYIEQLAVPE